MAFAWACNLGVHLGLTDMALFRYAKRPAYGLYSSTGMFLGHYVSWICAGIMGAAASVVLGKSLIGIDSGSVATTALGGIGAVAVVVAGWTTANPMLYRSGLAFQVVSPGWPRWCVTLIAGAITTLFACSPFVFTKMLDFVVVWIHLFFAFLPVWVVAAGLYLILAAWSGARDVLPELPATESSVRHDSPAASVTAGSAAGNRLRCYAAGVVAVVSLAACLVVPLWILATGRTDARMALFGNVAFPATITYFVSAVFWLNEMERRRTPKVSRR